MLLTSGNERKKISKGMGTVRKVEKEPVNSVINNTFPKSLKENKRAKECANKDLVHKLNKCMNVDPQQDCFWRTMVSVNNQMRKTKMPVQPLLYVEVT